MIKAFCRALVVALCLGPHLLGQSPGPPSGTNFSGTWVPANPEASDSRFNVGLSRIPGSGSLILAQSGRRFTVSINIPEDRLDGAFANGRFQQTVIYRVDGFGRSGGGGAAPLPVPTSTSWVGDRLVIPNAILGSTRPVMMTFSMEGEQLKIESRVEGDATTGVTITEFFKKVK